MKSFLSLVMLAFVSCGFASELLVIKGGREIHGRFLEESKTHITFYTDYGKKIQIHKSRISVLMRNGEVLALSPVVGAMVGIKPDNELGKNQAKSNVAPTLEETSKTIEPVTQNSSTSQTEPSREVASSVTTETVSSHEVGLKMGVAVGVIQSQASTGTPTQSRTGAEGGVIAELPFLAGTYLQPELLLSQSGYKDGDTVYKYSFVKVPLFIKYRFLMTDQFGLTLMAGPSLGFRSEAKSELGGVSTDLKSTTKSTIVGVDIGAGAEYQYLPNLGVFLNLRYSNQLNNLDTTVGATNPVKLRQLSFLAGFLFAL